MKFPLRASYSMRTLASLALLAVGFPAAVTAAEVAAPDASSNQMVLEEVIVTARRREEALQDTPVAISAFSAEDLKVQGIANTRDLQLSVPGLNFSEMGNKAPSIFIRGIGQKETNSALDPGVGVYINSIYIARTDSQLLDVIDTESIQVLRGPQGTLFGKNNTGGALLVTTKLPHTDAREGEASARVGNYGRRDVKVSGNLPLNDDTLAARVSVASTNLDGYLESTNNGEHYGDQDRLGATGRLYWQASDMLSADVFYYWSQVDENGAGLTCIYQNPNGVFNTFTWPGFTAPNSYESRCRVSEAQADDNEVLINGPSTFEMTSQILGVTLNWEYEDFDIKSITAWSRQDDIESEDDSDGTDIKGVGTGSISILGAMERSLAAGYGDFEVPNNEDRNQYSQELQVSGTALDERLSYTTGIFVAREEIDNTLSGNLVGYNGYSYKADVATLLPKILATNSNLTNDSYAIFAQGTYEVTPWYELTLGTRYTTEKRERTATLYEADCEAIFASNLVPGAGKWLRVRCAVPSRPQRLLPQPALLHANSTGG